MSSKSISKCSYPNRLLSLLSDFLSPIPPDLFNTISKENWTEARHILSSISNRRQVEYVDASTGSNALHLACMNEDTPVDILKTLLYSSEQAPLQMNEYGSPLHCAIFQSCDYFVLLIMGSCRRRGLAVADFLNKRGETPLHTAISYNKSPIVVESLLTANPLAMKVMDNYGCTPLEAFFMNWDAGLSFALQVSNEEEYQLCDVDVKHKEDLKRRSINEVCEIALLLLQTQLHGTVGRDGNTVITAFEGLKECIVNRRCPVSAFQMIARLRPGALYLVDEDGNTLLHIAAVYGSSIGVEEDKIPLIIDEIVAINGTCASVPNKDNVLPLAIAMQNVKSHSNYKKQRDGTKLEGNSIIEKIFLAEPRALSVRDTRSHMFPFMVTAVTAGFRGKNKCDHLQRFTNCYSLLMECPTLITETTG